MIDGFVGHSEIVGFCDDRVNLKRDDVSEYREQVNRLRKKLKDYIAAHPGFDLVKMLHSGSVAKGTALKIIGDMDVAVYVKKGRRRRTRQSYCNGQRIASAKPMATR